MIRHLTIRGYKGLHDVEIPLNGAGPTVFVGPNGAGKSSVFGALHLLHRLATENQNAISPERFDALVTAGKQGPMVLAVESDNRISWSISLERSAIASEILRSGDDEFPRPGKPFEFETNHLRNLHPAESMLAFANHSKRPQPWSGAARKLTDSLGPVRTAVLNASRIGEPASPDSDVAIDGHGLPVALLRLQNQRRKSFTALEARFRDYFPWVEEVQTPLEPRGNQVRLRFLEAGSERPFDASEMASGMLIALAILWMVMRPEPDRVICYEEPENSLHPYLLARVYELLGKASRGELGAPPVQVLIATQSVDFVNLCKPDEVRVFERGPDSHVRVHSVADDAHLQRTLEQYKGALGELWYSGAIGGIPESSESSGSG